MCVRPTGDKFHLKASTKPDTALGILIIISLCEMQRDKKNQGSYTTTFSADRGGGLSDLVDVTGEPHTLAPSASLYKD